MALNLSALMEYAFDDECFAFASIWMHSRSSDEENSNAQDYVTPRPVSVRTCSASGTKFFDLDADGVRDGGEPGIPRFLIWADYDDDGVRDANEPFAVTDKNGRYVIDQIRPPSGTYRLREELASLGPGARPPRGRARSRTPARQGASRTDRAACSAAAGGRSTVAASPNVTGRDFGNWVPASLTVEKQLWPSDDPGRFDLIVNGRTVKPAAGDGDKVTISVPPGTYNVSESAAAGTDPAAYVIDGELQDGHAPAERAALRPGVERAGPEGGQPGHVHVREPAQAPPPAPVPAIALEKSGPALAEAGDTLRYTLYVTNPGQVAIPANGVNVTDNRCDDPPALTSKNGDTSPQTLDPGDTWTYACSHETPAPGADCEQTAITNTATATGTVNGSTVTDDGSITTTVACPDVPPEPPLPPTPRAWARAAARPAAPGSFAAARAAVRAPRPGTAERGRRRPRRPQCEQRALHRARLSGSAHRPAHEHDPHQRRRPPPRHARDPPPTTAGAPAQPHLLPGPPPPDDPRRFRAGLSHGPGDPHPHDHRLQPRHPGASRHRLSRRAQPLRAHAVRAIPTGDERLDPRAPAPAARPPAVRLAGHDPPDDTVQVNPMWFEYDGEHLRFTHTNTRGKFRNLQRNPSMSLCLIDDTNPQSYLELRGRLVEVVDDPEGDFYVRLGRRYGNPDQQPPPGQGRPRDPRHERREGQRPLLERQRAVGLGRAQRELRAHVGDVAGA